MVTRLPADAVNVPGSMAIAATGRVRDAYDCAGITARQLRGIGVIDVQQLFGMRAVMPESQIDLLVEFEPWDNEKFYDRLGIEDRFIDILGKQVACVTVPIRPGRNLASIVEVAALNNRHRRYGYNAAEELARKVDLRADMGSQPGGQA